MKKRLVKRKLAPYLLLMPFLILMGLFSAGIINAVVQSLGYIPAFELNTFTLSYYREIFRDGKYMQSIGYSLWIAGISSVCSVILGVMLCVVLLSFKKPSRLGRFSKSLVNLPVITPHTIVALFVISIFAGSGLISRILFSVGVIASPEDFPSLLYDSKGFGVILAYLWKEIPFVCMFVMTVMANISDKYSEAALSLGAGKIKTFLFVTLPLCRPTIAGAFFIIFTYSFGAYELPFLLGSTTPKALPVQSFIEYTHPDLRHRPYAMVLNVLMIAVGLAASVVYFRLLEKKRKNKEEIPVEKDK